MPNVRIVFVICACGAGVKMKTIIVEGNIGAGKSTLLHVIQRYLDVHVLFEPIDMWQNIDSKYNLLEQFYSVK